jgi:flavin reductase (DIM6/NTAB) family NADH-FMN oxidoreductase RutF
MKFRPFNQTVSILAFKKEKEIYAATYAWFTQVGESEVVGLLGEQSITTHNLKVGDYCGISVCSKEQLDVALYIGDTHSNEVDKLLGLPYFVDATGAITLKNSKVTMILKVIDIIHLKDIEADSLVYFKIVEYKENSKLEHLLTSDVK